MTKFELPEKPKKTNTSEDFDNLRKAVDELDKFDYTWKTYANKADRRINAANKYIEELERENQRLIAENLSVKTLVDKARPQQALPVVPECVAGAIESTPNDYSAFEALDLIKSKVETLTEENKDWLKVYNWLCEGIENQDIFALAFITGKYQVEKPQLFYLKHIDMSKTNEHYDYYLSKNPKGNIGHSGIGKGKLPKLKCILKLTQQEIDSMKTGSYEQIEVAE